MKSFKKIIAGAMAVVMTATATTMASTIGTSAKTYLGCWNSIVYTLKGYPTNAYYYEKVIVRRYKDATNYARVTEMSHTSSESNNGHRDITTILCPAYSEFKVEIDDGQIDKDIACDPIGFFENLFMGGEFVNLEYEVQCTTARANDVMHSKGNFYSDK